MRLLRASSTGVVFLLWSASVFAADPCDLAEPPTRDTLWSLLGDQAESCVGQYVAQQSKRLEIDFLPREDETRKTRAVPAWEQIVSIVRAQCEAAMDARQTLCNDVLARAREALTTTRDNAFPNANDFAQKSAWDLRAFPVGALAPLEERPGTSPAAPPVTVKTVLEEACQGEGESCPQTHQWGLELVKSIELAKAVATFYGQTLIRDLAEHARDVDSQWDAYLFQSKAMYPLDLIVTDWAMKQWWDYGKSEQGLRLPPEYQFFLLHPAPGFEYVSGAADGEQLSPTVYVELLGFNKWDARGFSGVSLIAAYADRGGIDDVRGGLLFTYASKLSIAVTGGDGETGVVLGLDLANWYTAKLKPAVDRLR